MNKRDETWEVLQRLSGNTHFENAMHTPVQPGAFFWEYASGDNPWKYISKRDFSHFECEDEIAFAVYDHA